MTLRALLLLNWGPVLMSQADGFRGAQGGRHCQRVVALHGGRDDRLEADLPAPLDRKWPED